MFVAIRQGGANTSNSTAVSMDAPMVAKTLTNMVWSNTARGYDNGAPLTTPSLFQISSSGTTLVIFKDMSAANWTATGNKQILSGELFYEV